MDVAIYLKQLNSSHRRLTREEEHKLAKQAKRGDAAARETLMLSVMPMAVEIAKKYQGRGLDLPDLIQVANMGVIRAVEGFDPTRGTRLTTYATNWIKQKIRYEIEYRGSLIHLPVYLFKKGDRGLPSADAKALRRLQSSICSLDAGQGGEIDLSGAAMIEARVEDAADTMTREDQAKELHRKLGRLKDRERTVILGRMAGKTLKVVGAEIGVTRERVRQIEEVAMGKPARMYGVALPAEDVR